MTRCLIVSLYWLLKHNASRGNKKPPREKEVRKPEGEVI
jgi:hypothetical protein